MAYPRLPITMPWNYVAIHYLVLVIQILSPWALIGENLGSNPSHNELTLWLWAPHINPGSYSYNKPRA